MSKCYNRREHANGNKIKIRDIAFIFGFPEKEDRCLYTLRCQLCGGKRWTCYQVDSYNVFFDRPYTDTYIDMSGKECISHPHVLYYRDMPLDEVLKKGIQFSIDKDCKVVVMKTMECHDRH